LQCQLQTELLPYYFRKHFFRFLAAGPHLLGYPRSRGPVRPFGPRSFVIAATFLISDFSQLVWYLLPVAAGLYLFVRGFQLLARRRLLQTTPQSKIRSAALGLVEVSGLAAGPFTLHAPITGLPCFYYRTIAWESNESGRNHDWKKVAEEVLYVPFFLDDNTGKLLIDPRGAELDLHRDFRSEFSDSIFSSADAVPDNVRNFLLRHAVSCENKLKVEEYCIKPKNALFIVGTITENPRHQGSTGTNASSSIAVHKVTVNEHASPSPEVVYISPASRPSSSMQMTQQERVAAALQKAGITKPAAWEAAGLPSSPVAVETAELVVAEPSNSQTLSSKTGEATPEFELNPPVVLMKGKNDKTLVISWRSETALARSLAWKSALMLLGGPVLIILGLYFLLARTGSL